MFYFSPDPSLLEFIKCESHSFWGFLLLVCLTNEFRYTTLSLNCKVIIQVKPNLRYTRMVVGSAMHAVYAKAEKVPIFYAIFKALFGMVTRKSDAWVSDFAARRGSSPWTFTSACGTTPAVPAVRRKPASSSVRATTTPTAI